MKRQGNLFEQICSMDNLRKAHENAKKGKGWYEEVKLVDADPDKYLNALQEMLKTHTYHTSEYSSFLLKEGKKERKISLTVSARLTLKICGTFGCLTKTLTKKQAFRLAITFHSIVGTFT